MYLLTYALTYVVSVHYLKTSDQDQLSAIVQWRHKCILHFANIGSLFPIWINRDKAKQSKAKEVLTKAQAEASMPSKLNRT